MEMSIRGHSDLRELLSFAFTGVEEDRKQILDELKELDQPEKEASMIDYDAKEMQQIIEETVERITDRAVRDIGEQMEFDFVTLLSFVLDSYPDLVHSNVSMFESTFGALQSLLNRTTSEHTQTQCFIVLRKHFSVLMTVVNQDNLVKLSRMRTMIRVFGVAVQPNSIAYTEKLRAQMSAIDVCAQLLESKGVESECNTRLERFTLLVEPICELFASVFTREPIALQNVNLNADVQMGKRCFQNAYEALFAQQNADVASQQVLASDADVIVIDRPLSYRNSEAYCNANQERVAVTRRLFLLIGSLVSGAAAQEYSRYFRPRMLYLALCATWPFALVSLTSSSDGRFNRSLSSAALLAFRAFSALFEHSFSLVRGAVKLRAAGTVAGNAPSHAAHVRCVQSVLRVVDLVMRRSLIEPDTAVEMMHTLLCSLSVESLFTRLTLESPAALPLSVARPNDGTDWPAEDTKPSVLSGSQYRPAGECNSPQKAHVSERFLNEIVASLIFHICVSNSSNDEQQRPRAMCEFFGRLTSVVREAIVMEQIEQISLGNLLRFNELMIGIVSAEIAAYESELLSQLQEVEFADRSVSSCAAAVQCWTAVANFLVVAFCRPCDNREGATEQVQSFKLGFGLDCCATVALSRTNKVLADTLHAGLRLCKAVVEYEPMGVKRESLFDQVITAFVAAFEKLCSVYERLFEDNNSSVYTDDSEQNQNAADTRPACYRVRLDFDLLRIELNNWKSVITKVHSNPFLSNGKWCELKPRHTRRSRRNGFPKPRPKCKQRRAATCCSRTADKYSCVTQKPMQIGRGQFSKPRLAGLAMLPRPKSPQPALPSSANFHTDSELAACSRINDTAYDSPLDALGVDLADVDKQATALLHSFIQNFDADAPPLAHAALEPCLSPERSDSQTLLQGPNDLAQSLSATGGLNTPSQSQAASFTAQNCSLDEIAEESLLGTIADVSRAIGDAAQDNAQIITADDEYELLED